MSNKKEEKVDTEPKIEDKVEDKTEDPVIEQVINKLKKTIIIKKELSDKQKKHLAELAAKRKGLRYDLKAIPEDVENIPEEKKPIKKRIDKPVKTIKVLPVPVFNKPLF